MRLTTERLELEPITADCVDDIVSVVRSNPTFLMLHQGSGEAAQAFLDWARHSSATALRLGVDDGNHSAMVFWTDLGFVPVDRRTRAAPSGPLGVTVLEHAL